MLGAAAAALVLVARASAAQAHAFGARYDLPLPLDLYLAGAGAAVALSFVVMAVAFRTKPRDTTPWADLCILPSVRALFQPAVRYGLEVLAVALFALILSTGFAGSQETIKNLAPTFVWIIWWVGFAYVAALVGNIWPAVNPFSILFSWAERAWARITGGRGLTLGLPYPVWLGAWPAAAFFLAFAGFELTEPSAKVPAGLAGAILTYACLTWAGMWAFGREVWLANGEAFSRAFGVLGRFAPLGPGPEGEAPAPAGGRPRLYLRPYAGALVTSRPSPLSVTAFVVLMLATVTFDGFKETPVWGKLLRGLSAAPLLHAPIRLIHDAGFDLQLTLETAMLILFPVVFLLVYLGFAWATKAFAGSPRTVGEVAGLFVWSLVPIAIAYHLAHYLSYLVLAGQYVIPLASDPFGFGWNLFGTAGYKVDIGLIGAEFVWHAAVISIVLGHVIAVGVAHFTALEVFDNPRAALRSQVPLLVLMVVYTMISLWILSQPITGAGYVARLPAPAGTVTLAPFEFRERCYTLAPGAALSYRFTADAPLDFDIHYHDGLIIRRAVASKGTRSADGRFTASQARRYCVFWSNSGLKPARLTYRITGP